jgi:hypothetical protein
MGEGEIRMDAGGGRGGRCMVATFDHGPLYPSRANSRKLYRMFRLLHSCPYFKLFIPFFLILINRFNKIIIRTTADSVLFSSIGC